MLSKETKLHIQEFAERRAEAANDPILGKDGEVNRNFVKQPLKDNRRAQPFDPATEGGLRVTTFATQLAIGSHIQESQNTQGKGSTFQCQEVSLWLGNATGKWY